MTEINFPPVVKEMADGVSKQASIVNRYWIVLTIMCIAVIATSEKSGVVTLPLQLGEISKDYYYIMIFYIISPVYTAFLVSHVQEIRSSVFAHHIIEKINWEKPDSIDVDLKDVFDFYRHPTHNRVAPIAQALHYPNVLRGQKNIYQPRKD